MSSHVTIEDVMIDTPYIKNDNLTGKMLLRICFTSSLLSGKACGGPLIIDPNGPSKPPTPYISLDPMCMHRPKWTRPLDRGSTVFLNIKPLKLWAMDPGD